MSTKFFLITTTGERLPLTRAQLLSEPGNSLATRFLGDERLQSLQIGEIMMDDEVALVRLVHAHLRGYEVLPLPDGVVPYLSKEATLKSLRNVALELDLLKLKEKVERSLAREFPSRHCLLSHSHKSMIEITEEGYRSLLKRFESGRHTVFVPTSIPDGYRAVVSWAELMFDGQHHEWFVLLVSKDYVQGSGVQAAT